MGCFYGMVDWATQRVTQSHPLSITHMQSWLKPSGHLPTMPEGNCMLELDQLLKKDSISKENVEEPVKEEL